MCTSPVAHQSVKRGTTLLHNLMTPFQTESHSWSPLKSPSKKQPLLSLWMRTTSLPSVFHSGVLRQRRLGTVAVPMVKVLSSNDHHEPVQDQHPGIPFLLDPVPISAGINSHLWLFFFSRQVMIHDARWPGQQGHVRLAEGEVCRTSPSPSAPRRAQKNKKKRESTRASTVTRKK